MRKLLLAALMLTCFSPLFAQVEMDTSYTAPVKITTNRKDLTNKAGDHLMVQLASNQWMGAPDSISSRMGGLNRSANVYLMLNKPFKGNPKLSAALGIGVGTSNIYFDKMEVDITNTTNVLGFINTDSSNNFKKYKLATAYLEAPIELRYTANPENPMKGIKAAIGVKVGTLLNAHTKGKNLRDKLGTSLNEFTIKESSKVYFNSTRLAATARLGYGNFTLFGSYNFTPIFKDGVAADIKLLQLGLTLSGL